MEVQMNGADHSVRELAKVAQALVDGDFDQKIDTNLQGELGRLAAHIEALRQNLKSLSPQVASSVHLMPRAAQGVAEISQQAETSVNSILGLVDEMCLDQETVADILEKVAGGESTALDLPRLQAIADKSRTSLMSLMSFLSFQDVVRQRAEKVQVMIDSVEEKVRELLSKFHLEVPEAVVEEESTEDLSAQAADPSQQVVDQNSVDDLFK